MAESTYEELLAEALAAPVEGFDFSWMERRAPVTKPLPWNYSEIVSRSAAPEARMLDMGTGGGEALLELPARASFTVANEAWPPNVPVAAANLRAHGIPVVQDEGAPDNVDQERDSIHGRLPYRDGVFGVVANRHEAFAAGEVHRILRPGGAFITQQVDCHWADDLFAALDLDPPDEDDTWLPLAVRQIEEAGFAIDDARSDSEERSFRDVGAVVRYLRIVSWAIPGFDEERCDRPLRRLHARMQHDALVVREARLLVVARKA